MATEAPPPDRPQPRQSDRPQPGGPSPQQPGRPRERRVDEAIEAAVNALIPKVGYSGLTMDAVAARAGVGKAAIYRRYQSKAELVFGCLVHGLTPPPFGSDVSLLADLTEFANLVVWSMTRPNVAAAAPGMFTEVMQNDEFAARFRETFVAAEMARVHQIIDRAVARGELRPGVDPELVHASLVGTAFYWIFNLRRPVDAELPARIARYSAVALTALHGQTKKLS